MDQTCYRHPDRETGVSCANCGRPICPDCMTTTPVGMRCPECSKERTKVRSGPGVLAGGEVRATYVFIVLNVVVFAAALGAGGGAGGFEGGGRLISDGGLFGPAVEDGEWYRIVTSGFLHAGPFHLLLNMFVLYILGTLLEPIIGTARFVGIYFVSLLAGSFGALLLDPAAITVGASGAIYGIFGATILVARGRGLDQVVGTLGLWLLLNLAITFSIPSISIGGHLGGLAGGGIAALLVLGVERRFRGREAIGIEAAGMCALGALALAGALWAAGQGTTGVFG